MKNGPLDFRKEMTFDAVAGWDSMDFLIKVRAYCSHGLGMPKETLQAVVLKLIHVSRDLSLQQHARDEAAHVATLLTNAALKSYGRTSPFCSELLAGIGAITGQPVAAA